MLIVQRNSLWEGKNNEHKLALQAPTIVANISRLCNRAVCIKV